MSQIPSDAPPPYPGNNYNTQYGAPIAPPQAGFNPPPPQAGFAPPPQPYIPPKEGSYPAQGYAPAQPGYNHATTVVVSQPAVTVVQTFRESPVRTRCIHCHAEVITGVHFETGTFTWLICCVLWWVGLGLGCCLIPFCIDGCKDVIHTCPNCHQQIARFSRM